MDSRHKTVNTNVLENFLDYVHDVHEIENYSVCQNENYALQFLTLKVLLDIKNTTTVRPIVVMFMRSLECDKWSICSSNNVVFMASQLSITLDDKYKRHVKTNQRWLSPLSCMYMHNTNHRQRNTFKIVKMGFCRSPGCVAETATYRNYNIIVTAILKQALLQG